MLSEVFYWLFNMSISASVIGIIILLLGKIKKLPRRLIHVLWAIPFLRMWIPVGMTSKYSLMTLISKFTTKTVVIYDGALDFAFTNHVMAADNYSPITYKVNLLDNLFHTASYVWIIIAVSLTIISIVIYIITKSELKDASLLRDNIYVSDKITAPATYGVCHPKIIIPKGYELSDLHYILAHESAHIHRKDNLWRIFAIISASVHWFNPFIWLFLKKFLEETELACDERVLADCVEDEKKAYATALLDCTESRNVFVSAFGGAKIRMRIERILSYKKMSSISIISFTVFAIAIGYVLLTNAS
ncbi:MAG: M56 family metallopeptidase [Clostridiaceae bacterium]|nr:M56 family metallopeptidase [Clostridiaceae bacterium]